MSLRYWLIMVYATMLILTCAVWFLSVPIGYGLLRKSIEDYIFVKFIN